MIAHACDKLLEDAKLLPREKSHLDLHILYHFIMCGNPDFVPVFLLSPKTEQDPGTLEPAVGFANLG